MFNIHPVIPYFLAAALIPMAGRRTVRLLQCAVPILSYLCLADLLRSGPALRSLSLMGYSFTIFRADSLALLFVYAFLIFSFFANVYALHVKAKNIPVAANVYVGASVGAVLAGDLLTLFLFAEIMAVASAVLIWNRRRPASLEALFRYLLVHTTAGLLFFAGLMIKVFAHAPLTFGVLGLDLAGGFIFAAFAVNAAVVPAHAWLPDAYPAGTPSGSVYLSAFTTKVAVYVFARAFAGEEILIWLGAATALYGVLYALMENDIRRLLSYHIVCQIGYMICGIGIGTQLGVNAGTGHAIGNILFKGLLFMATGAVLHMTWKSKLTDLGGLARKMPAVVFFFMVGAFAISGAPLLNGYITKAMLVSAAVHAHRGWLELVLYFVAVGTFLSIALKLAYFAFWARPRPEKKRLVKLPFNNYLAMAGVSLVCLGIGIFPEYFYRLLPYPMPYHAYSPDHVIQSVELLLGAYLGFLLILKFLQVKEVMTLDTDWFYRRGGRLLVKGFCFPLRYGQEAVQNGWTSFLRQLNAGLSRRFARQVITPIGFPLLWITAASLAVGSLMLILR